jgi:CheY-like chemotaxis protein
MAGYVLVVDDSPDVQQLVLDVLETYGISGQTADDGQEALSMIAESRPMAIILDLMMPVMDGFTTLTRLQTDPKNRNIPIILLSALVGTDPSLYKLPGVVGVMQKGDFSIEGFRYLLAQAGVMAIH